MNEIRAAEYECAQAARHPLIKATALPGIIAKLFRILREIAARLEEHPDNEV